MYISSIFTDFIRRANFGGKNFIASKRFAVRPHVQQTSSRDAVCRCYPVQSVQNSACQRYDCKFLRCWSFYGRVCDRGSFIDLRVSLWPARRPVRPVGISISRWWAAAVRADSKTSRKTRANRGEVIRWKTIVAMLATLPRNLTNDEREN